MSYFDDKLNIILPEKSKRFNGKESITTSSINNTQNDKKEKKKDINHNLNYSHSRNSISSNSNYLEKNNNEDLKNLNSQPFKKCNGNSPSNFMEKNYFENSSNNNEVSNHINILNPHEIKDILKEEILNIQRDNFDVKVYLKKILNKILYSLKDSNFLIADRSMVIFKNEKIINQFISNSLDNKLIENLIYNVKYHWSQDIKMISNLVIMKIISYSPDIISNLSEETKKLIQVINNNINTEKEDVWDIHFNLKAD